MITQELIKKNLERKIIHVDMDYFYAAVELLDRPELAKKPIAVGGNSNGRGIICTSNYVARKYGVRSAMSSFAALKLCPHLTFLPLNFQKYRNYSKKIREIFGDYTDKIETLSLDEAYLDVTNTNKFKGSATLIAQDIKRRIFEETGLTASAGVSVNKMLSKVASEWMKPNGLFVIPPEQISRFTRNLELKKINGIGKVTAEKLAVDDCHYCKDIHKFSLSYLVSKYGKLGSFLYYRSRGICFSSVGNRADFKSISSERTFSKITIDDPEFLTNQRKVFGAFIERLKRGIDSDEIDHIHKIFIKIKSSDFQSRSLECLLSPSLREYINDLIQSGDSPEFFEYLNNLFSQLIETSGIGMIRLMGIGVRFRETSEPEGQLCLLDLFEKSSVVSHKLEEDAITAIA